MELLSSELSRLTLDPPHSMLDEEKTSICQTLLQDTFSLVSKYLRGEKLSQHPVLEETPELVCKVYEKLKNYLGSAVLPQTSLTPIFQQMERARELIRKEDLNGTDDKIVNILVGSVFFDIIDDRHIREAKLRSPAKTLERLYRYQSSGKRGENFRLDTEYKRYFQPCSALSESEIEKESFDEVFRSAGLPWIKVCAASTKGKRRSMEDTMYAHVLQIQGMMIPFFCLFDGHGGREAALWLKNNIESVIQKFSSFLVRPLDKLTLSEMENFLTLLPVKAEQEMQSTDRNQSGSTCLMAFVIGTKVFIVNSGDSRALLLKQDTKTQLTEDAAASAQPFLKGIKKRGGMLTSEGRIDFSGLNVARTIERLANIGATPRGKVTCFDMTLDEPRTLILACDGAFESTTSQMIAQEYREKGTPEAIVQKGYMRGSNDNISVMVVNIGGPLPQFNPVRSFMTTDDEIVTFNLSRIADALLRDKAVVFSQLNCLDRIEPWKSPARNEKFNIGAPSAQSPKERASLSNTEIKRLGFGAKKRGSRDFELMNTAFTIQNEKVQVFGLLDLLVPSDIVTTYFTPFISGILQEQFLSLETPPSKLHPHIIESMLSLLPLRVEQQTRAYPRNSDWGADLLIGMRIMNTVWVVRTERCQARLLVLQGDDSFQMTERPSSPNEPSRAQVTRRVFSSDKPLTLILGSEQLFDTCTSHQIADEYRDKKTAPALIQKAYSTGSGHDLTAYVLEMNR